MRSVLNTSWGMYHGKPSRSWLTEGRPRKLIWLPERVFIAEPRVAPPL
jgi:hypothetical protein